jgi:hypothetical protein
MTDEKEGTSIAVSSFILSKFSPCLSVSVFFQNYDYSSLSEKLVWVTDFLGVFSEQQSF